MKEKQHFKIPWEKLLLLSFFILSFFLMTHTFGYDSGKHEMRMASRVWSDFGAHIPMIRSFSLGSNWPPEYPIFPGEKIKYHFLFYLIAGLFERSGIRIDWAMNIPSIVGFFLLLVTIYKLAASLFGRKSVGVLSVLFFLFNGSFSFLKFFEKHPFGLSTIRDIVTNNQFSTFGPWDGNLVTAFVHLNIYTNQRHLGLSFGIVLLIIYILLNFDTIVQRLRGKANDKYLLSSISYLLSSFVGVLTGSLFFLNHPALLITVIFCIYLFLFHKGTRLPLVITLITTLPFLWYFFQIAEPGGTPTWEIGYLSHKPFEWNTFIQFWIHNLGLHFFLIPLGFLAAPKKIRFLFLPLIVLFILPNVYRFSVDMINNHKFFNFVTIIGGMYTANLLVTTRIFVKQHVKHIKIKFLSNLFLVSFYFLLSIFYFILTFSGLIDFAPIVNDYELVLTDIPANKDVTFIAENTPPDSIFLNSTWFYHPASLAGRKIYNGYSFFTWSAGYKTYEREAVTKEMYRSEDKNRICQLLHEEHISFVELNNAPEDFLKPIATIWSTFLPIYTNPESGVRIFEVSKICEGL